MRNKTFTHAYFLIKNNSNYMRSLIKRSDTGILWVAIFGVYFTSIMPWRLPATKNDGK